MKKEKDFQELFMDTLNAIKKSYEDSGVEIETEDISMEEIWIAMEDGVKLRAIIYKPRMYNRMPLVLQRSCYPQNEVFMRIHGEELAKRGYAYMCEYCRGTGGSEGIWEPNVNERKDGLDTLKWLERQDWVDCIGYWGDSYLALTGWAMADMVTEKVKSMCLGNYGTDRYKSAYEKRLFRHDVLTSWAMGNAGYEITADYLESCKYRPHELVDEGLWGNKLEWYRQWVTNTRREDSYWQQGFWKELEGIPGKVKIPVYISEGWFDHHLGSALVTWDCLSEEAKEHSWFDIGPLNHYGQISITSYQPMNAYRSKCPSVLNWFEITLKQKKLPEKSVNVYVIGEDRWKEVGNWPYKNTQKLALYLGTNSLGRLSKTTGGRGKITYIYDPENPTPSRGSEAMLFTMNELGSLKQPEPGLRDDVISFISDAVTEDIKIFGKIRVTLFVSTDAEDTAFSAKMMEITPDGDAYNIRSSITTLGAEAEQYTPNDMTEVHIDMWDVAWTVREGSRIRLDISSSDFPQYAVHSNYPGVWAKNRKTKKAKQTIYFGETALSRIDMDIMSDRNN